MKFGEELRNISSDISFEIRVWELMKPYLREIAKSNHPKGCHIVFEGEEKTFTEKMEKIVEEEDIVFNYVYSGSDRPGYGTLIWEKSHVMQKHCLCSKQRDISDKILKVILTNSSEVSIKIEKLKKIYRREIFFTYIS